MTIGSLFAGIGGLELGLERAGLGPTVWQVEQDAYCRSVLAKHWPDADRSVTDVCEAGAANLEPVDVICGGFPCQDLSYAGKGAGLDGARSGLWFEYLRIIRELRPRFVVVENVSALLTRGLDVVLGTLAESGYDALWTSLRAADVGAPHRRERIFIVAHARRDGGERRRGVRELEVSPGALQGQAQQRERFRDSVGDCCEAMADTGRRDGCGLTDAATGDDCDGHSAGWSQSASRAGECRQGVGLADTNERRQQGERVCGVLDGIGEAWRDDAHGCGGANVGDTEGQRRRRGHRQKGRHGDAGRSSRQGEGRQIVPKAQPSLGGATDGIPGWMDGRWPAGPHEEQEAWEAPRTVEGGVGRTARLKALGNAVVPQCAEVVGWVVRGLQNANS